jgi:DNA invertase Pin-like site-specific DNA recombinase
MQKTTNHQTSPARCYSYIRFSTPSQSTGDSLRRQTEDAAAWALRNGLTLDDSTTLRDLGKSAFKGNHRLNPDRNALAAFLKLVEEGKVPRGSFLLLENLDRLSREHIRPALTLLLNLIESGIRVVQLHPVESVYDDAVEPMQLMMALMELSRGNSESKMKSERVGKAYAEKRRKARVDGTLMTQKLPAWMTAVGGRPQLIPERAAVVKRIFKLAAEGLGRHAIVKLLTAEKVPAFGNDTQRKRKTEPEWVITYVQNILTDRRALGEYQPTVDGKPEKPIPQYYPPAVTEAEYFAARAGSADRRPARGRPSEHAACLFSGLMYDLRDGGTYWVSTRTARTGNTKGPHRLLFNGRSKEGKAAAVTFPYRTFERAVLAMLNRVDPDEVFGCNEASALTAQVLRGELDYHAERSAGYAAELAKGGYIPALAALLRGEEARIKELTDQLGELKEQDAKPLADSLRDLQGIADYTPTGRRIRYQEITQPGRLLAALDNAPTDQREAVRLKLQSHLRRVIHKIHLLVLPKGKSRFASVQIVFAGQPAPTNYLELTIVHKPAQCNGRGPHYPGTWYVHSNGLRPMAGNVFAPPAGGAVLTPEQLDRRLSDLPTDAMEALNPEAPAKSRWTWTEEIPAKTC